MQHRKSILSAAAIASALAVSALAASPALAAPSTGTTETVPTSPGGAASNGLTWSPSITPDGRYVTFESLANNLTTTPDTGSHWDIFVRDTKTGVIKKVSTGLRGAEANGDSNFADISADGRYVVFASTATNLVAGDDPDTIAYEIFVKDLKTDKITRLISRNRGASDTGSDTAPSVSADGSQIAFASDHSDLVPGDTNGVYDVFVWNRSTGKITRISVSSAGAEGSHPSDPAYGRSYQPQISADGTSVVFLSGADNLVKGDTNNIDDIFLHTLKDHRTTRVSVGPNGQQTTDANPFGDASASNPSISTDGRWIAYDGFALKGLVKQDTGVTDQVYVYDRQTGTTRLVARTLDGGVSEASNTHAQISPDGRFVAFQSDSNQLVKGDTGDFADVFVRDLRSTRTAKVSVGLNGEEANGPSGASGTALAPGGRVVVFDSQADNLVAGPANPSEDLYLHRFPKGFWDN